MGECFAFVNTTKREYLCPADLGDGSKRGGLFLGRSATALCLLVSRGAIAHPLCGSWAGDEVVVTGDQGHSTPSTDQTAGRTLWEQAHAEFSNVTYRAVALTCLLHESLAVEFATKAASDRRLLQGLAEIVYGGECEPLEKAFRAVMGKGWPSKLRGA